ncbi:hypothetical protein SASPL_156549 [Salvia splendens]|uniref:Xanthoxin dehydrogenase n=1 Tax=Salvia splendens TaxID=180675 RepID=A0A8X8VWS3_SALSN|nr:hypothetical protein SASPL_156549 [Salvia splendens]
MRRGRGGTSCGHGGMDGDDLRRPRRNVQQRRHRQQPPSDHPGFGFSEYERVMRVNARGMAVCVKQAARKMVELGTRGSIVCTASATAEKATVNATDYVMSKRAVLGLMRSASLQLGKHGIRVNSVSLGVVLTPLAAKQGIETPADVDNYISRYTSLKGATLTAENVADAVAFLASDEAAFVTGVDLAVDGGMIAMPFDLSN